MLLLAGFAALLSRYSGREDLLIGMPVDQPSPAQSEERAGRSGNLLPLRPQLDGRAGFRPLLASMRETVLAAFAHQDLPFEALVEDLRLEPAPGRHPLVQVALVLRRLAAAPEAAGPGAGEELRLAPRRPSAGAAASFDLLLVVTETAAEKGLALDLEYAAGLFTQTAATRLLEHGATLLRAAVESPALPLWRLPMISAAERQQAIVEWNDTAARLPPLSLHGLFEEQAAARPEALAVAWEGGALTYGELDRRAGRIASALRRSGVRRDDRVGLSVERSGEMVAAILGILKAGGAYMPLDPAQPRQRLERLLADGAPAAIVGSAHLLAALPGTAPRLDLDALAGPTSAAHDEEAGAADRGAEVSPESLAYVLFTSGSTGAPKGVEVSHRAVVRLVRETDYAAFGPGEVFLQLAPLSFDAATLELWGPLLHGGRLVLFPQRPFSLAELYATVSRHGVTTLWLTAGLFHLAVEEGLAGLAGLRQLLAGGDALSPGHVERATRGAPRRAADQRLRSDGEHDVQLLRPAERRHGRGPRADRPADREQPGSRARPRDGTGSLGERGRSVRGRRRPRQVLPRPARPDGGELRSRSVRRRRQALSHRRPRAPPRRRRAGVPRPPGSPGQGAGLPHRAGRGGERAAAPPGGPRSGGGSAAGRRARPPAGGLLRRRRGRRSRFPRRRSRRRRGRAPRLPRRAVAGLHGAERLHGALGAAADAERQGRPPGAAAAGAAAGADEPRRAGRAAHAGRGDRRRDLAGGAGSRRGAPDRRRRGLLRPRRAFALGDAGALPAAPGVCARAVRAAGVRGADDRQPGAPRRRGARRRAGTVHLAGRGGGARRCPAAVVPPAAAVVPRPAGARRCELQPRPGLRSARPPGPRGARRQPRRGGAPP